VKAELCHTAKPESATNKAQAETRRLLALLGEERPDADEVKDSWYALGLAVREAIGEIRRQEGRKEVS
jgi:hypothetical protein